MSDAQHRDVPIERVGRTGDGGGRDLVAVEEPLEIRLHGRPFAVVMRPGKSWVLNHWIRTRVS